MDGDIKNTIKEIIKKQAIILGPDIAISKAMETEGLEVSDSGEVLSVSGDEHAVLQRLVDNYVSLSGEIVKKAMEPLLEKHMDVNAGGQN